MNKSNKSQLLILLFTISIFNCFSQIEAFEYRTPIQNATNGWNSINLPIDVFSKTANNLNDIRIFHQIKDNKEQIEQPYILDIQVSEEKYDSQSPKIINTTSRNNIYSYTFELTNKMSVNKILLNFKNQNFDWKIKLEGSMDQNTWATIVDDYRITSFKRPEASFKLTDLFIPESKFNFYKISFQAEQAPILENVSIQNYIRSKPTYNTYNIKNTSRKEDEKLKTSIIELDLGSKTPVGLLEFTTDYSKDFYRPFKIEGLIDSFETEKGWKYRYDVLYKGTINSFNEDVFNFKIRIVNKLKITVYNYDDQPLPFFNYKAKGPNYRLITRLDVTDNLFLVYGNESSSKPKYDIAYFEDNIPDKLNSASLGQTVYYPKISEDSFLNIKNKWWLWGIMAFVILILGFFTLKMLRE